MKNKILITFCLLNLNAYFLFAQPPSIEWSQCYGGTNIDIGGEVLSSLDGGYIVCGATLSNDGDVSGNHGNQDGWVIKISSLGGIEWKKCYGGSSVDGGGSILLKPDSGYIIAGSTYSNNGDVSGYHGGSGDIWIINIDKTGNLIWQRCLGGSGSESVAKIKSTYDGNYIICTGSTSIDGDFLGVTNHGSGDMVVIKMDTSGNIIWKKCYGGSDGDAAVDIVQTLDSCFVIVGNTLSTNGDMAGIPSFTGANIWAAKIDSVGNLIWTSPLIGTNIEFVYSVLETRDSGFVIGATCGGDGGLVTGNHGLTDFWIVKINSTGIFQWQKCFGGTLNDYLQDLCLTTDNGFAAVGSTVSDNGDVTGNHWDQGFTTLDFWVIKIDFSGNLEWQKCLGGSGTENGYSIFENRDSGLIVTGEELTNNNGDVTCSTAFNSDVWVVKFSTLSDGISVPPNRILDFSVYQNKAGKTIDVNLYSSVNEQTNLQLIDIAGRVVCQDIFSVTNGLNKRQVFIGDLCKGIYFVRLQTNGGAVTKKVVIQ